MVAPLSSTPNTLSRPCSRAADRQRIPRGHARRCEAQRLHYRLRSLSLRIRNGSAFLIKSLTLYSTDGCHLCESAERLLRSMPELRRVTLDVVDIADDEALFARYGTSIPVLAAASREIAWPFNADDVLRLVS